MYIFDDTPLSMHLDHSNLRAICRCTHLNGYLVGVEIPTCITSIEPGLFFRQYHLTYVIIHCHVDVLPTALFMGCIHLETVTLLQGIRWIQPRVFCGCHALRHIHLPDTLQIIDDAAFIGAGLANIRIPDSVHTIEQTAFAYCFKLTSVVLPATLQRIEDETFMYCIQLVDVILPNTLTYIGSAAFEHTRLATLTIPASVHVVDYAALRHSHIQHLIIEGNTSFMSESVSNCTSLHALTLPDMPIQLQHASFYGSSGVEDTLSEHGYFDAIASEMVIDHNTDEEIMDMWAEILGDMYNAEIRRPHNFNAIIPSVEAPG